MAEQTITLTASAYSVSSSAITVTNPTNAYADLDSTSYASVNNSSSTNRAYFFGFDFSQIPSSATVTNVTYKIKVQNPSTGSVQLSLYNLSSSTSISNSVTATTYTTNIYSLTPTSMTFDDIAALGNNFAFSVQISTSNRSCYVYGMEVLVSYDYPATNKVIYNNRTLIDLTSDTVTAADVLSGVLFHLPSGEQTTGSLVPPSGGLEYESGTWSPTSNSNRGSISFSNTHSVPPAVVAINVTGSKPSNNRAVSNMAIDWQSLLGSIFSEYDVGAYTSSYVNSSGSWGRSNGTIRYGGSDSGSSSTSYFRYFATETTFMPYSGSSSVYWATNKTYNWIAIWK